MVESWLYADPILLPFLQSDQVWGVQDRLAELISQHAEPIIRQVVKSKFQDDWQFLRQELEDVVNSVIVALLIELQELKDNGRREAIRNFNGYVATLAANTCADYLRKKRPQRTRLQSLIRYVLQNQAGLALWQDGQSWLCGFEQWRRAQTPKLSAQQYQRLLAEEPEIAWTEKAGANLASMNLAELLKLVFAEIGKPLEFSSLVNLTMRLRRVQESVASPSGEQREAEPPPEPASTEDLAARIEDALYLKKLWEEIVRLPLQQRIALLLNLRDSGNRGLIASLPELGIAGLDQLAAVLEMSPAEFAQVWHELPLDDQRIAQRLGLERQQVINLRRAARRILARRLRKN